MTKPGEKIFMDPEIGEVTFRKSARSSRISIRVHPVKGVTVSLPRLVPYAAAQLFFKSKRDWVLQTIAVQKKKFKDVHVASAEEIAALRKQAHAELPSRLAELADRYGFSYNRLAIKHNATNWGSCSTRGNINLNLNIVRLPSVLRDYILLHELCHLKHHNHGPAFHLLLEHLLTDNLLRLISVSVRPDAAVCLAATALSSTAVVPAPVAVPASAAVPASVVVPAPAAPSLGISHGGRKAEEWRNAFRPAAADSADPLASASASSSAAASASSSSAAASSASAPAGSASLHPYADPLALAIARRAASSRAKYPLDHTFSREIKTYRLL